MEPVISSNDPLLTEKVLGIIKTCFDPEIPVDIWELGLIYEVHIHKMAEKASVHVIMTLTAPSCPAAGSLPPEVEEKIKSLDEVASAQVDITFDPPWDQSMMSEEARLELGFM
ncbi:MAG: iron-sulfur cluster assembly protein [Chitinophagaceae bacterium]